MTVYDVWTKLLETFALNYDTAYVCNFDWTNT